MPNVPGFDGSWIIVEVEGGGQQVASPSGQAQINPPDVQFSPVKVLDEYELFVIAGGVDTTVTASETDAFEPEVATTRSCQGLHDGGCDGKVAGAL
jgi:hypothetical protein